MGGRAPEQATPDASAPPCGLLGDPIEFQPTPHTLSEVPGVTEADLRRARLWQGSYADVPVAGGFRVPGGAPVDAAALAVLMSSSSLTWRADSASGESLDSALSGEEEGGDRCEPVPGRLCAGGGAVANGGVDGRWGGGAWPELDAGVGEEEVAPLPAVLEACVVRRALAQAACTTRACLGCGSPLCGARLWPSGPSGHLAGWATVCMAASEPRAFSPLCSCSRMEGLHDAGSTPC